MTIVVPLSQGLTAEISDADWSLIAPFTWCAKRARCRTELFYAVSRKNKKTIYMHRIVMGAVSGQIIDHKDGNGLNNVRSNLRVTDLSGNGANRRVATPRSGYRGVAMHHGLFRAAVYRRGKPIRLGYFKTAEEAARAFDRAAAEIYGEMAVLNFPEDAR